MIKLATELALLGVVFQRFASSADTDAFITSGGAPSNNVRVCNVDSTSTSLGMKSSMIPEVFLSALHHPVGKDTAATRSLFSSLGRIDELDSRTGTTSGSGTTTNNHMVVLPQSMPPTSTSSAPSTKRRDTALFSGFPSRNAQSTRTRFDRHTSTTMLRLSTTLRIPNDSVNNKFSSILSTTLQRQPKNFHQNVRAIKKKATLSSLILLAHLFYEEGENSRLKQSSDYILRSGRNTITHLETHRTRLSESSTFEFDRREHKEVGEGEDGGNGLSTTLEVETISGIGVGLDLGKNKGEEPQQSHASKITEKKKEQKDKIVELYSKSSDAGDRAFATLLELNMVELSTDFEEQVEDNNNEENDNDNVNNNIDSLIHEIDQVISDEVSQLVPEDTESETEPASKSDNNILNNMMKKKKVIAEYSKSPDAGDRAFATLLDLDMIELTPDPDDPSYDHSTDDLFAP